MDKHFIKIQKKNHQFASLHIQILKFCAKTAKFGNFTQSQLIFEPSHDGKAVTFRNSGHQLSSKVIKGHQL